jgi:hypothetical protein
VEPVEQDTQPTEPESDKVPLAKYVKNKHKAQELERQNQELQRQLEAAKQEQALQSLAIQTPEKSEDEEDAPIMPNPNDYLDDDEYIEAQKAWNKANTARLSKQFEKTAKEQAEQLFKQREEERQKTEAQAQAEREYQEKFDVMLEKADKLKVDPEQFSEAMDNLKTYWAPWFFEQAVAKIDNPEMLIMALGNDEEKAVALAKAWDNDPFSGGVELIKFAGSLDPTQTSGNLPEPDERVDGGAGSMATYEQQLAKKREENRKGKISMTELAEWKRANKPEVAA